MLAAACIGLLASAADVRAAAPVQGVAQVVTDAFAAISGRPRGELQTVELRFRGGQLRVDFEGPRGEVYRLLRRDGGGPFVLLDAHGGALPLPGRDFHLLFDPAAPCGGMGMMSDCRRLGEGVYAGRNAVRWRYRHGRRSGPGGTDAGRMWLDAATGLVLAYEADADGGTRPIWDVLDVDYRPQADGVFAPGPVDSAVPPG